MTPLSAGLRLAVLVGAAALAGCSSTSSSSSSEGSSMGSTLKNLFFFNATTPPAASASAPGTALEAAECPPVTIADGGAALRTLAARSTEAGAVASQISISDTARECTEAADGSVSVKVGVQGRVLLGPGGAAAKFDAPLRFVLKRGDRVLASRTRRITASLAAGEAQSTFTVVEDGFVVPAGTGEFEIEVGLGAAPSEPGPARARRSRS